MKLSDINENLMGQKLREISQDTRMFQRPSLQTMPLYDAERGIDSGSRVGSNTTQATGVPFKKRHRKYFNMSTGPENITL